MQTKQVKEAKPNTSGQHYALIVMIVLLVICAIMYFIKNSYNPIEPLSTYIPSQSPTQYLKVPLTHNIFIAHLDRVDENNIFNEIEQGIYKAETDYTSAIIVLIIDDDGFLSDADVTIYLTHMHIVGDDPSSITDRINAAINEESLLIGYDLLSICVEALCGISSYSFENLLPFSCFVELTCGNKAEVTFPNGTVLKLSGEKDCIFASFNNLCAK